MLVTSTAGRNRITRQRFASKHSRSSYSNKLGGRFDRSRLGMRNFRGIYILEVCGKTFFPRKNRIRVSRCDRQEIQRFPSDRLYAP